MAEELPSSYKKLVLSKLTSNFREAVTIATEPLPQPKDDQVLVKNRYVGVNATDVNVTAGRFYGSEAPTDLGFEGVGVVISVGKDVKKVNVGQSVAYFSKNAYAEYSCVSEEAITVIPEAKPEYVALIVSGLTAAIGLDKGGRITEGETVLITAAAGGCGHICVQWAKAAGCHVIATCSSEQKVKVLKELGCDRVINYKTEDLDQVLSKEYPKGVDVIWETIGGTVFQTCFKHLAVKGRLLVVGSITGYRNDPPKLDLSSLPIEVLFKSASVQGFLLLHYTDCYETYLSYLTQRLVNKDIRILLDDGKESQGEEFTGMNGIIKGVEHLHSGNSIGKVVVKIA